MEKWQQWRDDRAKELKDVEDHGDRREKLEEICKDDLYKITTFINHIKRNFPEKYKKVRESFDSRNKSYESIENSEDWDVEDISNKVPDSLKIAMEMDLLNHNDSILEECRKFPDLGKALENLGKKMGTLVDGIANEVSGGEYHDIRNFNHVVSSTSAAGEHNRVRLYDFKVGDLIEIDGLYVSSGKNPYNGLGSRPLMIMTPKSTDSRDFIKSRLNLDLESLKELKNDFFRSEKYFEVNDLGEYLGHSQPGHYFNYLFFLANYPFITKSNTNDKVLEMRNSQKVSWNEAFNIIVDLKIQKVFKKKDSLNMTEEVKENIDYYRKILKDEFGINLSHLDGTIQNEQRKKDSIENLKDFWKKISPNDRMMIFKALYYSGENLNKPKWQYEKDIYKEDGFKKMSAELYYALIDYLERHPNATVDMIIKEKDNI